MSPIVYLTLAYITGILLARSWLEDAFITLVLLGILLIILILLQSRRWVDVLTLFLLGLFALGGFFFAYVLFFPESGLPEFAGERVAVEGTVLEEPSLQEERTRYEIRVEKLKFNGDIYDPGGRLQLYLYHDIGEDGGGEVERYRFGEKLRVEGTLREPSSQRNPGGFDYRFFLRTRGMDAYMHARFSQSESAGEGDAGLLRSWAFQLRTRMIKGIQESLPSPQDDLLTATLFGQRDRLPEDVQDNFQRAGAGHLMAVSGLHVGLIAALILAFLRRFRLQGPVWIVIAIVIVFGYAYLTGMRPPAIRAAVMISLGLLALLLGRQRDFPAALSLAALLTLFYHPLLLFTVGFQLSYAATLSIFYLYPILERELFFFLPRHVKSLVSVTLAAQLGVFPLAAYHFHQLPLAGFVFNLLLLPVMALVVGLGLGGSLLYLVYPALSLAFYTANLPLLTYLLHVSSFARSPSVLLDVRPFPLIYVVVIYLLFIFIAAAYYRLRPQARLTEVLMLGEPAKEGIKNDDRLLTLNNIGQWIAVGKVLFAAVPWKTVIIVVLIFGVAWWWVYPAVVPDTMEVVFIDVGQGAAVYLETSCGFTALVDAGGELPFRDNVGKEVGERIILPFLYHQRVREIDLVVITHPHEDHYGGFIPVIEEIPVDTLMISPVPGESPSYDQMLEEAHAEGVEIKKVTRGKSFTPAPNLQMVVLLPPEKLYSGTGCDLNNNSVVIRATYGKQAFLLTGDIEEEAVRDLLDREDNLESQVLKVPHHGGYFESAGDFLEAVNPDAAVIQSGEDNPFGHPHPHITEALDEAEVFTFRNDKHGAVIFRTDGTFLEWDTMLPRCQGDGVRDKGTGPSSQFRGTRGQVHRPSLNPLDR